MEKSGELIYTHITILMPDGTDLHEATMKMETSGVHSLLNGSSAKSLVQNGAKLDQQERLRKF